MHHHIIKIGWDYKTTKVDFRDTITLSGDTVRFMILRALDSFEHISEATVIATCNRMEFYFVSSAPERVYSDLILLYNSSVSVKFQAEDPNPEILENSDAVLHLMRVAAGMESMMLGESQILSQVKSAYELLLSVSEKSPILNRLFQEAIRVGKQVREDTEIGKGAVSVSLAAVELSKRLFSDFSDKHILIVGAGETAELLTKHFMPLHVKSFTIVNRSRERGEILAEKISGKFLMLENIEEALAQADIVVTATASPHYLISMEMMKNAIKQRKSRPVYLVDIASPRNIDPAVNKLNNAYVSDMDNLQIIVKENIKKRESSLPEALTICKQGVENYEDWLKSLEVVPTISGLSNYFNGIRQQLLKEYEFKTSSDEFAKMDELSRRIVKRILHNPIVHLKEMAGAENVNYSDISTIWEIFKLDKMLEKYEIRKKSG